MKDWDADLYKRFETQRTQAARDLLSRVQIRRVKSVLDVGCGPGNSTKLLSVAYKGADILGIDRSPAMLKQAKAHLPTCKFRLRNANKDLSSLGSFDLIFSNAVFQWMPNHPALIVKLHSMLNPGGALAVQIPDVRNMKIQSAIKEALKTPNLAGRFDDFFPFNIHDAEYYYHICSKLCSETYLWKTDYFHILESHKAIIDWYSSAGFRPYHAKLKNAKEIQAFNLSVFEAVKKHYRLLNDNRIMFPFSRLFFILYKK